MAVPRTSVQPPATEAREPREGLSLQTLIIAAVASGVAAVIVSHFWARGTILASAMTPVVVAIISELLKKPVESDRLRGSVRAASSVARPRSGRTPRVIAPPPAGVDEGLKQRDDGVDPGPVRVYSSGSSKRPGALGEPPQRRRLKIAVITGLVAFLVAALALTLPELIVGGSVGGGGGNTTYFGGGQGTEEKGRSQDGESSEDGSSPSGSGEGGQQSPGSPAPDGDQPSQDPGGETTTPETEPATPPSQTPPPQTSPSPSTPTPDAQPPGP